MLGNTQNQMFNNAVAAPYGGLGGTRSAPSSAFSFYLPASFYEAPQKAAPTSRAYLSSDLGFTGFNTRLNQPNSNNGLLSTMLTLPSTGTLATLRPTLLPIG